MELRLRDAQDGVVGVGHAGSIDADETTVALGLDRDESVGFEDVDGPLDRLGCVVRESSEFANRILLVGGIEQQPRRSSVAVWRNRSGSGVGTGTRPQPARSRRPNPLVLFYVTCLV